MLKIIVIILESAIFVCALWVMSALSTLLHEAGHALGYLLATGDTHWHIRVGWGKRLLNTKRLTVNLLPFDGFFAPVRKEKIRTRAKLIMLLSGGPTASLVVAAGLLLLRSGGVSLHSKVIAPSAIASLIRIALFINLSILFVTAIPMRYVHGGVKGLESDGLQIIRAFNNREEDTPKGG